MLERRWKLPASSRSFWALPCCRAGDGNPFANDASHARSLRSHSRRLTKAGEAASFSSTGRTPLPFDSHNNKTSIFFLGVALLQSG